jgi:hypothetical protein
VRLGQRVFLLGAAVSTSRPRAYMDGQARLDDDIDGIEYTWYATQRYRGSDAA